MANWTTLKSAIESAIAPNGNQEITGQLLQNVLTNIVNAIGENATFAGLATLATNPGTPDGPVFYISTEAGIYPNFDRIEVFSHEVVILYWNNGNWAKLITGFSAELDFYREDKQGSAAYIRTKTEVAISSSPDDSGIQDVGVYVNGELCEVRIEADDTLNNQHSSVNLVEGKVNINGNREVNIDAPEVKLPETSNVKFGDITLEQRFTELESETNEKISGIKSIKLTSVDDAIAIVRVKDAGVQESVDGTRLRIVFFCGSLVRVSARANGAGVAVSLYKSLEQAIFAGTNYLQTLTSWKYVNEVDNIATNSIGYLTISMKKEDESIISDSDKVNLLSSLSIDITSIGTIEDAVYKIDSLTKKDAKIYRVNASSVTPSNDGTRLRLVVSINKVPCSILASCTEGKGVSSALFIDEESAIYYGGYSENAGDKMLEYLNKTYERKCTGVYTQKGYAVFSLCKNDSSAITDADMQSLLDATDIRINSKINRISENTEAIESLQKGVGTSTSVNNADIEDAIMAGAGINAFVSGNYAEYKTKKSNLTFAIISDIHGDKESYQRYLEYLNEHTDIIDYGVFLGDISERQPSDDTSWFNEFAESSNVPILSVVGNHDVAEYGQMSLSESSCKAKYFQNINKDVVYMGDNRCSWYLDNPNHKIRIIGLYEYCNSQDTINEQSTFQRRWLDSDVLLWFANVLANTPNDYKVVVLLHQTPHYPFTLLESDFTISEELMKISQDSFLNLINGSPICDIIDAYINRKSINKTYSSSVSVVSKTATINYDFSDAQGEFYMYFCGHWHTPLICKDSTYQNQITMANPAGSTSGYQRQWDDIPPTNDGRNQDNFTVVSIDTENKSINIVKVGGQVTKDMRKRKFEKFKL